MLLIFTYMNQLKLRNRRAKIVATLGPACETEKTIEELFLAGVDVFRLNFSHGSQEDHIQKVYFSRKAHVEAWPEIS